MGLAYHDGVDVVEPFAGANNIPFLVYQVGYQVNWKCYDISPSSANRFPKFEIKKRDSILDFPSGDICITNPPYLGKSSARRRKIDYPYDEDDLYKVCLTLMLDNCKYVAVIIPESFITANIHRDRLWGVISLTSTMFTDTDCPVCLAMFTPEGNKNTKVYSGEEFVGTLEKLEEFRLPEDGATYPDWKFNDRNGGIGIKTLDGRTSEDCRFVDGDIISPDTVVQSSRHSTRVSGLPDFIDKNEFVLMCNKVLAEYRAKTHDVTLTAFKGLRTDGKYRRRLDFGTARNIMNIAYREMCGNSYAPGNGK